MELFEGLEQLNALALTFNHLDTSLHIGHGDKRACMSNLLCIVRIQVLTAEDGMAWTCMGNIQWVRVGDPQKEDKVWEVALTLCG